MEPSKLVSDLLDYIVETEHDPVIAKKAAHIFNEFNDGDKCLLKKSLYRLR